ncbi:hypothetical protein F5Y16DRAFT_235140 [Xylariaceae sp. FL0255]|nr:hypothetical protein F5Y16DRAFT_235140 [Xylariaceae sp. FL0255]
MSIARALTTRRAKHQGSTDMSIFPQRSNTTKGYANAGSIRNKISSPMELTHTTNQLAYNAPDLYPQAKSASSRTSNSDDDSSLESPSTTASSPPTSPEMPAAERMSGSPEPNHLSCYFTPPTEKPSVNNFDAPAIPKRSPSHTKKASLDNMANRYARLSNQSNKTVSSKASTTLSRSSSTSTAVTTWSLASSSPKPSIPLASTATTGAAPVPPPRFRRPTLDTPESQHPFGHELAKVSELAEELGMKDELLNHREEEQALLKKGLCKFMAEDYLSEIQGLLADFLTPDHNSSEPVWI